PSGPGGPSRAKTPPQNGSRAQVPDGYPVHLRDMTAAAGASARPAPRLDTNPNDAWRRPLVRYGFLVLVAAATFALDQFTKELVKASMDPGDVIPVIPPVLDLHYITNRGVAFGLFSRFGDVFVPIALVIMTVIFGYYRSLAT